MRVATAALLPQGAVVAAVGAASRLLMSVLGTTHVTGGHHITAALQRPPGQALITVSNHVSALDDPLVTSTLLPQRLLTPPDVRWTLCATDRCFKHPALAAFFRAGKVDMEPWGHWHSSLVPVPCTFLFWGNLASATSCRCTPDAGRQLCCQTLHQLR